MINKIINSLKENISFDIVCDDEVANRYKINNNENILLHIVNDPRSAIFYTLGLKSTNSKPTILIIDSKYESDIVTGLTESWFQKIFLCVFILNSEENIFNKFTSRNCISNFIEINENNIDTISSELNKQQNVPVVFNIKDNDKNLIDKYYLKDNIFKVISNTSISICVSEDINLCSEFNCLEIKKIISKGVISRYVGSLLISKPHVRFMIVTYEEAMKSFNVFSLPYINNEFKLIVLKNNKENQLIDWVSSNKIEVFNRITCINDMAIIKKPSVMFYEI